MKSRHKGGDLRSKYDPCLDGMERNTNRAKPTQSQRQCVGFLPYGEYAGVQGVQNPRKKGF